MSTSQSPISRLAACREAPAIVQALKDIGLADNEIGTGLHFNRGSLGVLTLPGDLRRLSRLVREHAIDVVHAHRADEQWLAALVLGLRRARLVRTWHRDPRGVSRTLRRALVRSAAGTVCVSRDHIASLETGRARIRYIPPTIDTNLFQPVSAATNGIRHIGQVARWKREKGRDRGQRFSLEVFRNLAADPEAANLGWSGAIIGRGELEGELRAAAYKQLELNPERVQFVNTEALTPQAFAAQLGALSVGLVFCVGSDGASRPALEMLSCGVPLLVADVPGLAELAEDNACVQVIRERDPQVWAQALKKLLNDPARLATMSLAARKRAEERHSLFVRGRILARFYAECAG